MKGRIQHTTIKLSVIIACLNGADTMGEQLEALARQEWSEPWEVIFADNGSTDGTVAIVEEYRDRLPALRVIDASEVKGKAWAVNKAVQDAARGDAIAFCDADDIVAPGWVQTMGEALQHHDLIAGRFDVKKLNKPWIIFARHGNPQADGLQTSGLLPHAGGGNLGVKRSVFLQVGGMDTLMHTHEDTDFCWRVQMAGTELQFVPDALVYVRFRSTLRGIYRQACGYARGRVHLYERYGIDDEWTWRSEWNEFYYGLRVLYGKAKRIRTKADLGLWLWDFGAQIGRLQGRRRSAAEPEQSIPVDCAPTHNEDNPDEDLEMRFRTSCENRRHSRVQPQLPKAIRAD